MVSISPVLSGDKSVIEGKAIHVFVDQWVLQAFDGKEEVFRFDVETGRTRRKRQQVDTRFWQARAIHEQDLRL